MASLARRLSFALPCSAWLTALSSPLPHLHVLDGVVFGDLSTRIMLPRGFICRSFTNRGLNANAVHIIVPAANKNTARNHDWRRKYISLKVQSGKFLHLLSGTHAEFEQMDTSRTRTNADQPGRHMDIRSSAILFA